MITISDSGNVIVTANNKSYDLSITDQYADFLLWVTSPDEEAGIGEEAFKVAEGISEEYQGKAARYAEFLLDYAQRRQTKLNEMSQTLSATQREAAIKEFIERLEGAEA